MHVALPSWMLSFATHTHTHLRQAYEMYTKTKTPPNFQISRLFAHFSSYTSKHCLILIAIVIVARVAFVTIGSPFIYLLIFSMAIFFSDRFCLPYLDACCLARPIS